MKYRKYRYMDHNLTQRRQSLEEKIPDIRKTLAMVEYLQERRVCCISLLQLSGLHYNGIDRKVKAKARPRRMMIWMTIWTKVMRLKILKSR